MKWSTGFKFLYLILNSEFHSVNCSSAGELMNKIAPLGAFSSLQRHLLKPTIWQILENFAKNI